MTSTNRIRYLIVLGALLASVRPFCFGRDSQALQRPDGQLFERGALQRLATGANALQYSGIYPHLASFNGQGECGTGAVVSWSDRLWWITYSPHMPDGSDDKLYAANQELDFFMYRGSVGGTPANRMIHRESKQLLIGPYLIDSAGRIRVLPPRVLRGRLTGNARHLTDPENKVYYATMEEGFYEVDVRSLATTELFADANNIKDGGGELLPGYHGKGLYAGQGVLVYANNGEKGERARTGPTCALAPWPSGREWATGRLSSANSLPKFRGLVACRAMDIRLPIPSGRLAGTIVR